jgi:segregation and condensation protein B
MAETNTTTQPVVVLQVPTTMKSLVEALIFGAREPLTVRQIQVLYEEQGPEGSEQRKISFEEISRIVEGLNAEYSASDRPYRIIQLAGGYQYATQPAYAEWLGKLYKEQTRRKLSQSSVETLAIIAYKQPITKPELESIRGVNCDYVIKTLLEKDLATIVGRAPTVGRPLLYGTSKEFLKHFGLNDLNDLPRPREIQEILGESQFETERRMLEAQQGLDEVKKEEDFKSRLPHIPKRKAGLDDDVKILPRKRTREIKVRPADESQLAIPEPTQEAQPVRDAPEPVAASELEAEALDVPDTPPFEQSVPTTGNETGSRNPPAETGTELSEPSLTANQSRYIGLTHTDTDESEAEVQPIDEPERLAPLVEEVQQVTPPVIEPTAAEEVPTFNEPPSAEAEVALIVERTAGLSQPSGNAPSDELTAQKTDDFIVAAEGRNVIPRQSLPPIIEKHMEIVGHSETQDSHPGEPDTHSASESKTRWKTWKEKIQGFIKKLFG